MYNTRPFPQRGAPAVIVAELLLDGIILLADISGRKLAGTPVKERRGSTLRPGDGTPLWNALRKHVRPLIRRRGEQVKLARILGLPRQRVNEYFTRAHHMPDAERTLQILAWLVAVRRGQRPG